MNYFEKHIGDWITETIKLSMLEEGAYSRLIDQYHKRECPLPLDMKENYREARATSSSERKAVDYVMATYFEKTEEGFVHKRAQEAIERYWDRDQAAEGKKENGRERQQRARERRKTLFEELRSHGIVPEFNTPTKQLSIELSRVTDRSESRDTVTHVTRDDTCTQTPIPNTQSPSTKGEKKKIVRAAPKSPLPDDFGISPTVQAWADKNGHASLGRRLEHFVGCARAKGYTYADWDQAFQNAVREDWAKLNSPARGADSRQVESDRRQAEFLRLTGSESHDDGRTFDMETH